jgi:hypothetical protein
LPFRHRLVAEYPECAAGEAVQPVLKVETRNVETIRPVSIFDDTNGKGGSVKDDDNFDEWAK